MKKITFLCAFIIGCATAGSTSGEPECKKSSDGTTIICTHGDSAWICDTQGPGRWQCYGLTSEWTTDCPTCPTAPPQPPQPDKIKAKTH